ncbi:hypothetical protein PILCRDRAFT_90506 [Piloderma croceum F 1598]|uniref:Uncharacterized protein n=1 Tax=Piloderma croceum (strain F 1598) TaxID=765440 RepID=A0A0C3FFM6_PILCF|nr:hypothetical protein PILCRDRAFT_90506 [Piloderma croceum F 1598]
MHLILLGHWSCKVECVEGVQRVVMMLNLKGWGAALERTSGRQGVSPQMADTECTHLISLGCEKMRGGEWCRENMWGEVEIKIEVVGPPVGENKWEVGGFTLNGRYQAHLLDISEPWKMRGVECKESMWGEVETNIEVVGPWIGENEREVGGFTPNSRYQTHVLSISGPWKMRGWRCRGSMWSKVETKIEVVGPQVGENEWEVGGGGFHPEQKRGARSMWGEVESEIEVVPQVGKKEWEVGGFMQIPSGCTLYCWAQKMRGRGCKGIMWVKTEIEVVGPWVGENKREVGDALNIAGPWKMGGRGCKESMWGKVESEIEVGPWVGENKQKVGGFTPNSGYRADALNIAGPQEMKGRGYKGIMWVETEIEVVGPWVGENKQEVGFHPEWWIPSPCA